ncbi:hypothetical protein PIB30_013342 [Stylosanthes scabra]|uniref:Uncharacterized protein n=1 Tax=Stylosanthes scabra TaxID=79078 RepID=A0ABU6U6N8_9FABA|nr:hypothetical protein [Stylosanthes scabra]
MIILDGSFQERYESALEPSEGHRASIPLTIRRHMTEHMLEPLPPWSPSPIQHKRHNVPKACTHCLTVNGEPQLLCNVLERNSALAPRHVERMGLWAPPLYEGTDERVIDALASLRISLTKSCSIP